MLLCFYNALFFNKTFLNLQLRGVTKRMKMKKTPETIKKELLESILEVFEEENYLQICEKVKNAKNLKDGISLVKKYEDLLKSSNKKIINIVAKQGELAKRFKDSDEFFDDVGLSRSNIYFKIRLYKFLCKFPALRNSTHRPSYFKNNFKIIKKVCKANADIFGEKKSKNICIFYPF